MKILLDDERADALEFLWESIRNSGYNVGIARDYDEIEYMLDDTHHDIILTSGCYKALDHGRIVQTNHRNIFVVGIKNSLAVSDKTKEKADQYLVRPFRRSVLLRTIENGFRSGM
jgi:DNA-binding response OmpR family regulator